MRGRGNNRKGPNPLTRSYESNGPDVKIRGTAQQIAEKYATLARDAQSSGDRVMAENYLQHAEHYNRLIAAAQAQIQPQQNMREMRDETDEDLDERDEQETFGTPNYSRPAVNDGSGPQPVIDGVPAEVAFKDREMSGGNGSAKPNGRGHGGANGAAEANGAAVAGKEPAENAKAERQQKAADKPQKAEKPQDAEPVAAEASPESATEEAPAPKKRTRRPRAKKAEDAAQADATPAEGAPVQG